ncbi:MAG TPA: phosphoglucosamine mutase [Stellaceae bacterium]|nr:phosphoglucosamine mutase [Stellaceae bacterium]
MTRKLFGTDGIRGTANLEPMTPETALQVAMATGRVLRRGLHRNLVVIGKDTRLSGYMIEPALTAGFIAMGMDVDLVGPMPTPAIAMLTHSLRADLGVMISASHNPFEDNGIKLFGPDGNKLSDEIESAIEAALDDGNGRAAASGLGRARRLDDAHGRYIEVAKSSFPKGLRLDGVKIVIDCANGAAYKVAPAVLWELGAEIYQIGVSPDGFNINDRCGATHPDAMREEVVRRGAHIGLALDGDADRLIVADEQGRILDGDQIMALIALEWRAAGRLAPAGVVSTVMSNLGFERCLASHDIRLTRTAVGDRYVVEEMRRGGANLGGEQSGHIIMSDYATTGDGLISALQVLAALVQHGEPASRIGNQFTAVPQLLRNVRYNGGAPLDTAGVRAAIKAAEGRLAKSGRVLVRPSGTEPLIRIMAEGDDMALIEEVVGSIEVALRKANGATRGKAAG